MKDTILPRRRYGIGDYPNLDPDAIGKIIPIGYGTFTELVPTEIDTTIHKWKIVDQAVDEITEIRSATKDPLVKDIDYTEDLANGEFTLIFNTYISYIPTYYYFALEPDYDQSDTNYFGLSRNDDIYTEGKNYEIDDMGTWYADTNDRSILFTVYGKTSGDGPEVVLASNDSGDDPALELGLNDASAHRRIGQSFRSAYTGFITKITVWGTIHGSLTGKKLKATIYSDTGSTQVGNPSTWVAIATTTDILFNECNENEELTCDIKSPDPTMTKVADILDDLVTEVMDKSDALLDPTELGNLDTLRTEDLRIYLAETIEFGELLAKLEAGQMWKLVPLQDGSYGTIVYKTGEPGNTPHFYDHDFLSFKMELDASAIKQTVTVFYDQATPAGDYLAVQNSSQIARFFYLNESEHEVETYLKNLSDADDLASDYLARFETPIIRVIFEVHGWALDLLPGRDKVKITRARAAYAGGKLDGVLFRITKLVKKPETNVVEITAAIWGGAAT
jgi:hypothetical protein